MTIYIALIRGINVGGKNRLPMKALVAMLETMGCCRVKTYIQSGNAVFESDEKDALKLSHEISLAIGQQCGFEPSVIILKSQAMQRAMAENPFPQAAADPKAVHLGFLSGPPESPNLKKLAELRKDGENFRLLDQVFYLYTPEGIGRSKLAANAEKLLGVAMTSRNWQTVGAIRDLTQSLERSG